MIVIIFFRPWRQVLFVATENVLVSLIMHLIYTSFYLLLYIYIYICRSIFKNKN